MAHEADYAFATNFEEIHNRREPLVHQCDKTAAENSTDTSSRSIYTVRTPRTTLDGDVVLAPETRRMFDEAIGAMRHHKTIYSDWGFGSVDPTGRNMILNFYGPPGTITTIPYQAVINASGDVPDLSGKVVFVG